MGKIQAEPYEFDFDLGSTALLMIDMQRDFVEPGGFGETLGNDVSLLRSSIEPCKDLLETARKVGLFVIHTREGHRPDLADLQPAKRDRGNPTMKIGDIGPMGRILVRGEPGHDLIPELAPIPGEPVIDKPGKGSFFATVLEMILHMRGVRNLVLAGFGVMLLTKGSGRPLAALDWFTILTAGAALLLLYEAIGRLFGLSPSAPRRAG